MVEGGEFPFRGGVTLRAGFDNLICHPPPSLHTPQRMTFIMGSVLKTPLHTSALLATVTSTVPLQTLSRLAGSKIRDAGNTVATQSE